MVFGREIDHGQLMTPLKFEVTRSKVKFTLAFNAKNMSVQYREKFMSESIYLVERLVIFSR